MESLTDCSPETKPTKIQDRVSLGRVESEKVEGWVHQINQSSKGFLTLTKSDVVNFIVRSRRDEFLPKELAQIRADHYDPIRHITWITPQIKAALSSGDMVRVAELQEELRGVELSVIRDAMTSRRDADSRVDRSAVSKNRKTKPKSKPMPEATSDESKINAHPKENMDASPGV